MFQLDETKLSAAMQRRLRIRRRAVSELEAIHNSLLSVADKREFDKAVLDHARKMLRAAQEAPLKAVRLRIRRTEAYKAFHDLESSVINNAVRSHYRDAILGQCTPPLSAQELAMADFQNLLPSSSMEALRP